MIAGARRYIVSKGKQFVVEYRVPADQVPSNNDVYVDIIDSSGNPVGAPTKLERVPNTDVVKATLTAPSTVGKYELYIWIGTWDGTNRNVVEPVDYLGLEVVDKDLEDRVVGLEQSISSLRTDIDDIKSKLETIMKWLRRKPL